MSRYKLRANYDIENIDSQKMDGTVIVDVPMLSNGELNYGLSHIKKKLYEENVYPSEIGFDIMSLATMVYMADTRIERVVHGQDSWTREIELEIPVSNVEIWDSQIHTVERMLKFLTGDLWKITLSSRAWQFNNLEEVREKSNKYDEVSLFSGGMDSLISTINLMENKKNTLLISHAGEGLTKNAQKNIVNKFDLLYPDVLHTWLDLWMVFPRDYIPAGGNDNNTRSRSFLFIGYALFAMTGMDNINELLVPENGLIALNVPLDETRVGSFSTRTTHPFYLSLWNELLVGLGLNLSVKNPYWNKTKGEMAGECKNKDVLYETMKLSFSCSSPGKARWKQLSQQHCGYCVPCLIRRAAMHKAFTLYHKGQREVWNNTEILNGVGRIEAKDQQIQSVFGNELIHIMETAKKASEAMSVAQQKKAEDRIKAAGEEVKNYSVFQDWMNDMDLKNRITDK